VQLIDDWPKLVPLVEFAINDSASLRPSTRTAACTLAALSPQQPDPTQMSQWAMARLQLTSWGA
jgi:hypothetical protein